MLSAMEIFKYLPASKKLRDANCKACGLSTCMMFALKLSKNQINYTFCPKVPHELAEKLHEANKIQQKEVIIDGLKLGGEKVMYRHEKTFYNPCGLFLNLDFNDKDFEKKYERVKRFEIECVGNKFKLDGIYLENSTEEALLRIRNDGFCALNEIDLEKFQVFKNNDFNSLKDLISKQIKVREKAIKERLEQFSDPILTFVDDENPLSVCTIASALICKYSSAIVLKYFDEAVLASLITLRLNIFTDPEKPLKVDSKIYEFNNPDENALVFMTTNFALTYFAVSNELSQIKRGSYLIVTPSEGMSVLTAWSAEKITAEIVAKMIKNSPILDKIRHKNLIIPGYLADLKIDLDELLDEWQIVIGTQEAYKIPSAVKEYNW